MFRFDHYLRSRTES
jgi:hypothetical protein